MNKIYKIYGLPSYIFGCNNKKEALDTAIENYWNVNELDLCEVNDVFYSKDKEFNYVIKKSDSFLNILPIFYVGNAERSADFLNKLGYKFSESESSVSKDEISNIGTALILTYYGGIYTIHDLCKLKDIELSSMMSGRLNPITFIDFINCVIKSK